MNTNQKEYDLFNIIEIFINKIFIILLPSLLISIIFFFNLYLQSLDSSKFSVVKKKYYILDNSAFELASINQTINNINNNYYFSNLFNSLDTSKFQELDNYKEKESRFLTTLFSKIERIEKIQHFSKNFFYKQLNDFTKTNEYLKYNLDLDIVESPLFENEFQIIINVSSDTSNEDLNNIFKNIERDLSYFLKDKVNNLINSSMMRFDINTENLIETISKINMLLKDTYRNELLYKIEFLKEQRDLAKSINLKDYSLQIQNRNEEFISVEEYLKGYEFIEKKIYILNKRLSDYFNNPGVLYNQTIINLLKSGFLKKQIFNEINSTNIQNDTFSLLREYQGSVVKTANSIGLYFMICYSLILFLVLIFIMTIFVIFHDMYNNRNKIK